jgi:hypothetical protein
MNNLVFIFVGVLCLYVGVKILSSEERTTVYNKRPIEVTDVKKYNRYCGFLTIGFGVVADLTIAVMDSLSGWFSLLGTLLLIAEAFAVVKIYGEIEKKMLKKR